MMKGRGAASRIRRSAEAAGMRWNERQRPPLVIALDTSRDMRAAIRAVLAGVRQVLRKLPDTPVSLCAMGDHRCHLLQFGNTVEFLDRMHICNLDRSFETAMHFYARRAGRGVFVMCGNGLWRDAAPVDGTPYTRDVLRELRSKFAVRMLYVARGAYDADMREWETLLGTRNVAVLKDPRRTASAMLSLIRRPGGANG